MGVTGSKSPAKAILSLTLSVLLVLSGCSTPAQLDARAAIVSSDGAELAVWEDAGGSNGNRVYPLGASTPTIVGGLYADGTSKGIEQAYASELTSGCEVQLTIDSKVQKAAAEALGDHVGSVVVLDPNSGAVLGIASSPAHESGSQAGEGGSAVDLATHRCIPGSTFKTVTLAAALESGEYDIDSLVPAPPYLDFAEGSISNAHEAQSFDQPLEQAYIESTNTVFAQLALSIGLDSIEAQARKLGFDQQVALDFPVEASTVLGEGDMSDYMQAWTGVGQALQQPDGELEGPVMTPLQGAAIAAAVVNGGTVYRPHVVSRVGQEEVSFEDGSSVLGDAFSYGTAQAIMKCMRGVVREGTGTNADVAGVDVGGKTGTADTPDARTDAWFIGFAQQGDESLALAVVLEEAESDSAEASRVASRLIRALF